MSNYEKYRENLVQEVSNTFKNLSIETPISTLLKILNIKLNNR